MCRSCIHVYQIEEDQAVGSSQILRIDPSLGFLNRIAEIFLFSLKEQMNQLYVYSDSDIGFPGNFRFPARCRQTVRFKLLIGGSWLNTAVDVVTIDVATIECVAIVVLDSSRNSERH